MSDTNKPFALSLMGPTASGKTELAMRLLDRFPELEIISVDSSLVYRGMDIGTAKPDAQTRAHYPHRLVDIREIDQPYSASDFRRDALKEMETIWKSGKTPFLVGGTMLYFKALSGGMAALPAANPAIRKGIVEQASLKGWASVHEALSRVDPVAAQRIHPNDSQRLQRALEVFELTGKPLTELQAKDAWNDEEQAFSLASMALITDNRALLHQRIEQRFRHMLAEGLLDEVKKLKARFPEQADSPAMKAVGYRQVWQFLDGEYDEQEMLQRGLAATRQLAKRQITWLRSWPNLTCFDVEAPDLFGQVAKKVSDLLEIKP